MALAKLTGHSEMKARSLLTAHEDYTTLQFVTPYALEKPGALCSAAQHGAARRGAFSRPARQAAR